MLHNYNTENSQLYTIFLLFSILILSIYLCYAYLEQCFPTGGP